MAKLSSAVWLAMLCSAAQVAEQAGALAPAAAANQPGVVPVPPAPIVPTPSSGVVATVITKRPSPMPGTVLIERGTLVRLMVTKEVSSRTSKAGDRFSLRVDEDVVIDGARIVPIGATAWGEIATVKASQAAGVSGQLGANLLYVDAPGGKMPIQGDRDRKGATGGAGLGLAIYSFGPFGLLLKGNDGRLRAGDIFNGYVSRDLVYDPVARKIDELPPIQPAANVSLAK